MTLHRILHLVFDIISGCPETKVKKAEGSFDGESQTDQEISSKNGNGGMYKQDSFRMPLHYPRYKKGDYEKMEEWRVDNLLQQYGMAFHGTLEEKRGFAMGAFLWPDQL